MKVSDVPGLRVGGLDRMENGELVRLSKKFLKKREEREQDAFDLSKKYNRSYIKAPTIDTTRKLAAEMVLKILGNSDWPFHEICDDADLLTDKQIDEVCRKIIKMISPLQEKSKKIINSKKEWLELD